ncbi:hypothetical protein [Mycobacterium sp. HM-7]
MNAGVALVGAGVIALTPVAAPPTALHAPALPSAATVELTAFTNPLETWASVATATFANLGNLGQVVADNPFPLVRQLIAIQVVNANKLAGIAQTVGTNFVSMLDPRNPFSSASYLQKALTQIASGDFAGAIESVYTALIVRPAYQIGFPLLTAYDVVNTAAQHFQKFVAAAPGLFVGPGMNFLFGTLGGFETALGHTVQGLVDAVKAGDIVTAASIALNAPAVLTGAMLNGYAPYSTSGLLGKAGPVRTILRWLETAAEAIGKPKPKPAAAVPDPASASTISTEPASASAAPNSSIASPITPSPQSATSASTVTLAKTDSVTAQIDSINSDSASKTDDSAASASSVPQTEREPASPAPKPLPITTPGQAINAAEKAAAKAISTAGKQITSATNKIGEDLKKTFTKPRKPTKADTSTRPTKADSDGSNSNKSQKASSGAAK